jgi:hypothetical protein
MISSNSSATVRRRIRERLFRAFNGSPNTYCPLEFVLPTSNSTIALLSETSRLLKGCRTQFTGETASPSMTVTCNP